MDSTQLTPIQVGSNCARPDGEIGRAVGVWMNRNNLLISKAAYAHLEVSHGDRLLEVGPGNGALVGCLVMHDNAVTYKGIDISETMIAAALDLNAALVRSGRVDFVLAPAESISFADGSFDRAVSVNCIYFWDIPKALREIHRVLVPGGRLVVASNSPETMANNTFAKPENGFRNISLDSATLRRLHTEAGFSRVSIEDYTEDAKRMDGSPYVRRSFITIAVK